MFRVNSLKCATLTAHTRRSVVVPEKRQALSSMPACAAQFRNTSYFCLLSIQRHAFTRQGCAQGRKTGRDAPVISRVNSIPAAVGPVL